MTHQVVVLAFDGVVAFDLATPGQILGGARDDDDQQLYNVRVCTPDGKPVRTTAGFGANPQFGLDALAEADTVVVPGIHHGTPFTDGTLDADVTEALQTAAARGRVMSICTGAFVLAAAGLLDGLRATTHWLHAARFRELYPAVQLDPDVLFVDSGHILTSAGVAAGVDLCLHVVRSDHGSQVANRAARRSVVPPWRDGGQSQYIDSPMPERADASTAEARAWAVQHLDQALDLEVLADRACMSLRTFTRRFRDEVGMSPGQWLVRQRVERARELLESTQLPVDEIARQCGFGTGASLRQHIRTVLGISPSAYRRTFRTASL